MLVPNQQDWGLHARIREQAFYALVGSRLAEVPDISAPMTDANGTAVGGGALESVGTEPTGLKETTGSFPPGLAPKSTPAGQSGGVLPTCGQNNAALISLWCSTWIPTDHEPTKALPAKCGTLGHGERLLKTEKYQPVKKIHIQLSSGLLAPEFDYLIAKL